MNDFAIGTAKEFINDKKAHEIPLTFQPDNALPEKERKVLAILDTRAYPGNGDTKIANDRLSQITGYSLRTIERVMHQLEAKKFITRFLTRGYDRKRARMVGVPFYTLRVIRCNRVALVKRFQFKTGQELGWRTDNRPVVHIAQTGIDPSWFIERPISRFNYKTLDYDTMQPAWTSYMELLERNAFIPKLMSESDRLAGDADYGIESAILIMGVPKRR